MNRARTSGSAEVPVPHLETRTTFAREERFIHSSPAASSDVIYNIPVENTSRRIFFGTTLKGYDPTSAESAKSIVGPGSYDVSRCYDSVSEWPSRRNYRFGNSSRESSGIKTPSPGAVYNLKNAYWNGPDHAIKIGFNCDQRKPLYTPQTSANAKAVYPRLPPSGRIITIGRRIKSKAKSSDIPGPIYDVLVDLYSHYLRMYCKAKLVISRKL